MMPVPNLAAAAVELAEALNAEDVDGLKATADPAKAGRGPIVFVPPPAADYSTGALTWQLVCLAGSDQANLQTFEKLAALVELLDGVAAIEAASPGVYALTNDQPPVPAYLVRLVTD